MAKLFSTRRARAAIAAVMAVAISVGGVLTVTTPTGAMPAAGALAIDNTLRPWEGRELKAYLDKLAKPPVWTICDGDTQNVKRGMVETPAGCDERLRRRMMTEFYPALLACIVDFALAPISWQAMMISLAWNIGACGRMQVHRREAWPPGQVARQLLRRDPVQPRRRQGARRSRQTPRNGRRPPDRRGRALRDRPGGPEVTALLSKLRTYSTVGLVLLLVAVAGYAVLQDRAHDARRERDEAVKQRQAAERAIIVLADERAQADERKTVAREARDGILSLPVENEPPVAESLHMGLQAADRLGGIE